MDCHRTWESVLLGGIAILQNSTGLWPLYKQGPFLVENDLTRARIDQTELLSFEVKNGARKELVLAQHWFDRINSFRGRRPWRGYSRVQFPKNEKPIKMKTLGDELTWVVLKNEFTWDQSRECSCWKEPPAAVWKYVTFVLVRARFESALWPRALHQSL